MAPMLEVGHVRWALVTPSFAYGQVPALWAPSSRLWEHLDPGYVGAQVQPVWMPGCRLCGHGVLTCSCACPAL